MRVLLRSNRADDELAKALARAGLYVERVAVGEEARARIGKGLRDVAVIDPRLLEGAAPLPARQMKGDATSLEEFCYRRIGHVLDKLQGATLPNLYATVMAQSERALLRLAMDRMRAISAAAELLGIHRNTLARRLDEHGLRKRDDAASGNPGRAAASKPPARGIHPSSDGP